MLDIIIAVIVLIGLWRGYQAGFIRTAIGLVGWFIALVAATRLADDIAPQMTEFVASPVLQTGLAFLAVVLVVLAIMQVVGFMARSLIKGLKLSLLDQMAGGVLGATKNILVILVMLSISAPVLVQMPMWTNSTLAPELLPYAPFATDFTKQVLGGAWEQLNS